MKWTNRVLVAAIAALLALPLAATWAGDNADGGPAKDGQRAEKRDRPDAEARRAAAAERREKFTKAMAEAQVTLADGIQKAEAASPGKAIQARFVMQKDRLVVEVQLILAPDADGQTKSKRVVVDAATGEVAQRPQGKAHAKPDGAKPHGKAHGDKARKKDKADAADPADDSDTQPE